MNEEKSIEIFFPGTCVPKGRPRVTVNIYSGKAHAFTPRRTREWSDGAKFVAKNAMNSKRLTAFPKNRGVIMNVEFIRHGQPNKRPDIFNLLCQIADVLNAITYEDDCQVEEVHAYQKQGKIPMTRVEIVPGNTYKK